MATTVRDMIESLQKLDLDLEVMVSYDGGFAHREDPEVFEGTGKELYNYGDNDKKLAIIYA